MNYEIAIIGPKDAILGFSTLGVVPFESYSVEQAIHTLKEIKAMFTQDGRLRFAVVLVTEELIKALPKDEYRKITRDALPAIISVPGVGGSTGFGDEKVRRMVEQAVGSDIFGEK